MRQYTDNEKAAAKMIIRFFNMQAGTAYRSGNEDRFDSNINLALRALEKGEVAEVKNFIRDFTASGDKDFAKCMEQFIGNIVETVPEQIVQMPTEQQVGSAMGLLEQAVVGLIVKTQAEKIKSEIMGSVEETIRQFIQREYGTIERKITTVIDGRKADVDGVQHEKFDTVLKFVANDEPVFLTGPAGSGKNVLCKQVAEAMELDFYFTNAVTQEYKLTGFTDAMGVFHETQFYKAFKNGGLFLLDEMDASIPEVLVILNAAIANRYFDFPAPIGFVEANPNFRVIVAGNTTGHGASYEYVGRNQLDAASLDRFAVVEIDYSKTIEDSVAGGDIELADFCRSFRAAAKTTGQQVIVSYRAIGRLAKMLNLLSIDEALQTCLTKGMEKDDIRMIVGAIPVDSKYKRALERLAA